MHDAVRKIRTSNRAMLLLMLIILYYAVSMIKGFANDQAKPRKLEDEGLDQGARDS
jgi:hypothetical protein